jgi:hypothetical protein
MWEAGLAAWDSAKWLEDMVKDKVKKTTAFTMPNMEDRLPTTTKEFSYNLTPRWLRYLMKTPHVN